jgi:hypothetical protein
VEVVHLGPPSMTLNQLRSIYPAFDKVTHNVYKEAETQPGDGSVV